MGNTVLTDKYLTKQVSDSLKGLSSIEIMIGHIGGATGLTLLYPNRKAGVLFVGLFFFISGYGLMNSLMTRPDYLKGFLCRRLLSILVPAYVVYLVSGILRLLQVGGGITDVVCYIFLGKFYKGTNWFVFEISAFYVVFYFLYKFCKRYLANVLVGVGIVLFIAVAYIVGLGNPWYGSSLCFPLGIFYAQRELEINEYLNRQYWMKNFTLLVICGVGIILFFCLGNDSILGNPIARNIAAASFVLWIISVIQKVRLEGKALEMLGSVSYEIFLVHPVCIGCLSYYNLNSWIFTGLCIFLSVLFAWLLHIPCRRINRIIHKKFS